MAGRVVMTEANRSGSRAIARGKHGSHATRIRQTSPVVVLRMPPQYSPHDIEQLLDALWVMFTESQARKLVVNVPWDESEEPSQMVLADLAALMESWLG